MILASIASGDDQNGSVRRNSLFSDNFATATLPQAYRIEGNEAGVSVAEASLSVSQGVRLVRRIDPVTDVAMEYDIVVPAEVGEGTELDFSIGFNIDDRIVLCSVRYSPFVSKGADYSIELQLNSKEDWPLWSKRIRVSPNDASGRWRLAFCNGGVSVEKGGRQLFSQFISSDPSATSNHIEVRSAADPAKISHLAVSGIRVSGQRLQRLAFYTARQPLVAEARSASADHHHDRARVLWQKAIDGFPPVDERTPWVAFIQLESALAEITSGDVNVGISRMVRAWPELLRKLDAHHPWRIAGSAIVRRAHDRLKRRLPDPTNMAQWIDALDRMHRTWAELDWGDRSTVAIQNRRLRSRWKVFGEFAPERQRDIRSLLKQMDAVESAFAQGKVKSAAVAAEGCYKTIKAINESERPHDSWLTEELGDLSNLMARAKILMSDLDLGQLRRLVELSANCYTASLSPADPKLIFAEHNLACVDYLQGDWGGAEQRLRQQLERMRRSLGGDAPETYEVQFALGMLLVAAGNRREAVDLLNQTLWETGELAFAGWLPIGHPTLDTFLVRQEPLQHPSLIMFMAAAAPAPTGADPLATHADSLALGRLAARVDQMFDPLDRSIPWSDTADRARSSIERLAPPASPWHSVLQWLGYQDLTPAELAALPDQHPWRIWLRRRGVRVPIEFSPPSSPVEELDEYRSNDIQQLEETLAESVAYFGADHPESAWCHENFALANYVLGRMNDGQKHAVQATEAFTHRLGPRHRRSLAISNTLGIFEYYRHDLRRSYQLLEQTLRDRRAALGDDDFETLRSTSDLAVAARAIGKQGVARRLIHHAVEHWPVPEDQDYRDYSAESYQNIIRVNLAVLKAECGDYLEAEAELKKLIANDERSMYRKEVLLSLSSIATMRNDLDAAEAYLLDAQKMLRESKYPQDDPKIDHLLGVVYREQGKLERARAALTKSISTRLQKQSGAPQDLGDAITSLAILEQQEGNLQTAFQLFSLAHQQYLASLGAKGIRQADAARRVALSAHLLGKQVAVRAAEDALAMKRELVDSLASTLSETEALLLTNTLTELEPLLSALAEDRQRNAVTALTAVWKRKAIVAQLMQRRRVRLDDLADGTNQKKSERLRSVRRELATLLGPQFISHLPIRERISQAPGAPFGPDERLNRIRQLTAEKEALQRQLAEAAGRGTMSPDPTPDEVIAAMPAGAALIEFVKVNHWPRADQLADAKNIQPESRYQLFLLGRDAAGAPQVHWHDLGAAKEIDEMVRRLRYLIDAETRGVRGLTITDEQNQIIGDRAVTTKLGKLLTSDWIHLADKVDRFYIVPDGGLHAVPWNALPGLKSDYLVQEAAVVLRTRGSEPFGRGERPPTRRGCLLLGNIDYGQPRRSPTDPTSAIKTATWKSLEGTKAEMRDIAALLHDPDNIRRLEEGRATETAVIETMQQVGIAHFATHGFYHRNLVQSAQASWQDPLLASALGRNPLSRCGLVLSGANRLPGSDEQGLPHGDDGLLTGEEMCDLDLRGVELVVLSACETGLGEINDNEGAFGMQRALFQAGVRATIGSLWKVSDDATSQLMTEIYRRMARDRLGVADALRQAQLSLLDVGLLDDERPRDYSAPFFWAAFTVAGDPDAKLPTSEPPRSQFDTNPPSN
nr:CHAT domain-containing protein [Rhodopirellula sp. JC639]